MRNEEKGPMRPLLAFQKHDPEKWAPVSEKIMLQQKDQIRMTALDVSCRPDLVFTNEEEL